ncbi:SDR family oxidoreductase [Polyangium aurulentum]|uniref:SDR family oxidoreductase n=1 Tax=Polyangium aurulentum TaxID=2567896 RepID=UPI0010AE9B9D|nr:SDR family oxidoreductase [Polyangium aurulentum]
MSGSNGSMAGKIVLITGASRGIGKATAMGLGRMGARLCLVVRDLEKGKAVAAQIAARGNRDVEVLRADLASQADIKRVAAEFDERHDRLDVLINNAGALCSARKLTVDGIEHTFAVNHLAYFMLTCLLRDKLKASAPARIINVSSSAHARGRIDLDDLGKERKYGGMGAYSQSKLANVLFTYELARRLAGTGVTANCLHPGVVFTGFGGGEPGWLKLMTRLATPFMLSEEEGAETSIYLASSPEVEGVTGAYFVKSKRRQSSRLSYDAELSRKLWEASEKMTGVRWD